MEFRLVSLGEIVQIERTWMNYFLAIDFKPAETVRIYYFSEILNSWLVR